MADFLWRKVSDSEVESIKNHARAIMDSFSKKLDKIGKVDESFIERDEFEREEGVEKEIFIDRDIMFKNAPHKNKDFIIAEKGDWK